MRDAAPSNRSNRQYNVTALWILIGAAAVYTTWLLSQGTITGRHGWDGAIGVVLGLYICSRPVGNALALLFAQNSGSWPGLFRRSGLIWLALNFAVLITGWFVVALGATRLPRSNLY